ncbi:hypothetical protein ACTFIR_011771 [Dictyostelium discoideum]
MNNENIVFSGDGKGLSFRKFKQLIQLVHGNQLTKADIVRKLRGNALEFVATLDTDLTAEEILDDIGDSFELGDSDELSELTKLSEYKFNTLDALIGKFLSKCSVVDITEKFKIEMFYSAVGTELGIEITKSAPKSLKRAIQIAKSCEEGSIRMKGRSMYTGQLVSKTLLEFGSQNYLGSGSGYGTSFPQSITSQTEQSVEAEVIATPIFNNQQVTPQSSPYKTPQNHVNSISTKYCKYCKKKGHLIQECWSKDKQDKFNENKQYYNNNRNHYTNTINIVDSDTINSIGINNINAALLINNKNVRGLVDTGSSLTIIWESIAKKLNLKVDAKQFSVNSASNNEIKIIGISNTIIKLGNASARISVNIVKDNDTSIDCIFGIDTIMGLNLIIDLREMIIKNIEFNVGTKLISRETKPTICILNIFNKPISDSNTQLSKPISEVEHPSKQSNENDSVLTPPTTSTTTTTTIQPIVNNPPIITTTTIQPIINNPPTTTTTIQPLINKSPTENHLTTNSLFNSTKIQPSTNQPRNSLSLDFTENYNQICTPGFTKNNLVAHKIERTNDKGSTNVQVNDLVYLRTLHSQAAIDKEKLYKSWADPIKIEKNFQLKGGDM